jgi:hypothetical protein
MNHRKLRIAWSVGWGLLAVLLVVLWVRSYWWVDQAFIRFSDDFTPGVATCQRGFAFVTDALPEDSPQLPPFEVQSFRRDDPSVLGIDLMDEVLEQGTFGHYLVVPYVMPALIVTVLTFIPWLRWRFSLRSLLIAVTLVAVVLGFVAYAVRG